MSELDIQRARWWRRANIPVKHQDAKLVDLRPAEYLDPDHLPAFDEWVTSHVRGEGDGRGLAIIGPPGFGKTTLSCAILRELVRWAPKEALGHTPQVGFSMDRPLVFTEFATYLTNKRQLMKMEQRGQVDHPAFVQAELLCEGIEAVCLNDAWNCRYAVLDDVGKEHTTSSGWAENVLDEVLRHRFNRGFPTIITSNKAIELWDGAYSESMKSFAREAFIEVGVSGEDRRA